MKKVFSFIPNTLTCLNLASGCVAVVLAMEWNFIAVFWLVIAACVFDFFDGFSARMLDARSPIGGDLDSLADMVSFGFVPAMVLYKILPLEEVFGIYFPFVAFFVAVFSALRLAKFNVDTRQSEEFRGLATPASALLVVSLGAIVASEEFAESPVLYMINSFTIPLLIAALCALMVCDLPMFSFKFKSFGFRENAIRYIFIIFSLLAVILLGYAAPAAIILTYILTSFCLWLAKGVGGLKLSDNEFVR